MFLRRDPYARVHFVALDEENTDILRICCDDAVHVDMQLSESGVGEW